MGDSVLTRPIVRDTRLPNEIRTRIIPSELRADPPVDPNSLGTMDVRFSRLNEWYKIESLWEGTFLERVAPGAFKRTIREDRAGMQVLFNHGFDMYINDKVLGPIQALTEEEDSPLGVVPLFDTSYNRDLLPGLRAGVYGSSFRFRVREEKWNDEPDPSPYNPTGLPERTLTDVRLFEFGPVTFPANPLSTASMRSGTDYFMEKLAARDGAAYEQIVRSVRSTRPVSDPQSQTLAGLRYVTRRRLSPRVQRALSGPDAAALQDLLGRLAVADATFDPLCDAICAADDALDDALITVSGLLNVPNPDAPDPEDMMPPGTPAGMPGPMPANAGTIPAGSPTRSGSSGERAERSTAEGSPGNGDAAFDPMDDPKQRHLLLRSRGVI